MGLVSEESDLAVAGGIEATVHDTVRRWSSRLLDLSHSLHGEPELGLAEHRSAAKVADVLTAAGFTVELGVGGLATAVLGRQGAGELVLALCAEYDALPVIGHACGHNVNGAAAVGAGIALGAVADRLDITVKLVGTPAEETIGGKIPLLEAGIFDDVAGAMMVHAGATDEVNGSSYALSVWDVDYEGRAAHAAAAPWHGVNAADAVTLAYQAVGLLRQQLRPDEFVSFVIHEAGGAANVIPAHARAVVELRATSVAALHQLQSAVRRSLDAGAMATGAELTVRRRGNDFAELRQDAPMSAVYSRVMRQLGRSVIDRHGEPLASTDMGNVSHLVPSIHPTIGYEVAGAVHHTAEFAEHGVSPSADRAVLDAARGLALTGVRLASDPDQRARLEELRRLRQPLQGQPL